MIYLITQRENISEQEFFKIIQLAVEGGVNMVQLREKKASFDEMCLIGHALLALLAPQGIPLIINDRVDVAKAIHAAGVHLGQSDLNVAEARAFLGKQAIIGLSVGSENQASAAEDQEVDYIAAGPIFPTKTKLDCGAALGLAGLKRISSLSSHPVIAIGGINETNAENVLKSGASGIAFSSAIFKAACPKTAAQTLAMKVTHAR